jgi:peptidoglycan/xylan/chitin deacetylase (PgdA/CDA1 family)
VSAAPRATACFSYDNLGEAAEIGAGRLAEALPPGDDASLAVGYPALFALLERRSLRSTFFIEGWNGVHHPAAVREITERGHELGMHGWLHETWHALDPATEAELAQRATDALEAAAGVRPRGFRAPGGRRSAATEGILQRLGYRYDASLHDDAKGATRLSGGLAQVPFVWAGVDGAYYLRPEPVAPEVVRDTWLRALARSAERGGLFVLICHAFLTGVEAARVEALEAVIETAQRDSRVAVRTVGEAAGLVR